MSGVERRVLDAALEFAAPDQLRALQMAKLKPLLARTWDVNPFFREHWQKARVDLDRIDDLSHFSAAVPMVDKAMFVEDQAIEPPYGRRHRHVMGLGIPLITMTSSGTSGQGVEVHLQTNEDLANHNRVHSFY